MDATVKRDQLQKIDQTVEFFEQAGADLVFRRPGMIVRLKKGGIDLALNDGERCSVVRIDLSHPDNEKLLSELAKGLQHASTLKAVESPLIRMGLTLSSVTLPFFEKISQAKPEPAQTIRIRSTYDGANKLVRLKAEIPGQAEEAKIETEEALRKIQAELETLGVQGSYQVEMKASRHSLKGMNPSHRMAYFEWMMQPLPSPATQKRTDWAGLDDALQRKALLELLEENPAQWKSKLWGILGSLDPRAPGIEIPTGVLAGKERELALLQAVVEDYQKQPFCIG